MTHFSREVWVTSALTTEGCRNALVLCNSLRANFTSRRLVIIASPKLSVIERRALWHHFDVVFFIEEDLKPCDVSWEDFTRLYAIGVCVGFQRCFYISPSSISVRNPDDLFTEWKGSLAYNNLDMTNFIFQPSPSVLDIILNGRSRQWATGFQLSQFLKGMCKNLQLALHPVNCCHLNGRDHVLGNESDISIVTFSDDLDPMEKNMVQAGSGGAGLLTLRVLEHWHQIYEEKVAPILSNQGKPFQWTTDIDQLSGHDPIAIVGMSCRLPGSKNVNEFWKLLVGGNDGTCTPPPSRWRSDQCSQPATEKKMNAGFLTVPVDEFDAKFFGVSPKEAVFIDPQHRIILEVAWEALEDALINPLELNGTSGSVFVGSWTADYLDILRHSGNDEFFRIYLGNFIGSAAARLSHLLKVTGPSVATENGCSSSMVAVHLACNSLRLGQTDLAIAAGVNLILNPFDDNWMPMVTSADGHCKTFCERADGIARAEGCGVLVLKRLSDAVRDGDNIWALIRGSATSQEGISRSMGTPTVIGESLAMTRALKDARVKPEVVTYVEVHGTGTPIGDPLEIEAIAKAYHTSKRVDPLIIGSVKTNVGHTESCSGITGIIKTALAMKHSIIPAHRNFERLNPSIDLTTIPAVIPLKSEPWALAQGKSKIAGVSSFGLSGTDAHVILQEFQGDASGQGLKFKRDEFERPLHALKVSARSEKELQILLSANLQVIKSQREERIADIAHSGNTGRPDFSHRAVIIGQSREDIMRNIEQNNFNFGEAPSNKKKICFLFPGQGSQYPGMAKGLYETSPTFRIHFDYFAEILKTSYNINIRKVLWDNESGENINRTIFSQTSIFCVQYALLKLIESWGVSPDFVLGHSLGEYVAAVCAQLLSVEDAIKLVAERCLLVDQLPEGRMLVLKADKLKTTSLLHMFSDADNCYDCDIAALNSEQQTVVAGEPEKVSAFAIFCANNGVKCTELSATSAFHSRQLDPILDDCRRLATEVGKVPGIARCKFISGMRGQLVEAEEVDADYWVRHTRECVSFLDASKEAVKLGCGIFVEVGPHPILTAMVLANNEDSELLCLSSMRKSTDEWSTLLQTLGQLYLEGVNVNWSGLDQFYPRRKVRALPHYPFQRRKFWPSNVRHGSVAIHPLLGSQISNASPTTLFQSTVSLENLEYLRDHVIGKFVIFPGAAYLEMCMAAGIAAAAAPSSFHSLQKLNQPVKIENLIFKEPMLLDESKRELQTVLQLEKNEDRLGEMRIEIFEKMDAEPASWLLHASASFSLLVTTEDGISAQSLAYFESCIDKEGNAKIVSDYYSQMALLGLHFGPSFRSLEKVWLTQENSSLLAKINLKGESASKYIIHPVILDAMIQVFSLHEHITSGKGRLAVALRIESFIWLRERKPEEDLYVYLDNWKSALLLGGDGRKLAVMAGVELASVTVKRIEASLERQIQGSCLPNMWEEVWQPTLANMDCRCKLSGNWIGNDFPKLLMDKYRIVEKSGLEIIQQLNTLSYYNIVRALYQCGLVFPPKGEVAYGTELFRELGIKEDYKGLFRYYLEVLLDEGILRREHSMSGDIFTVLKAPPTMEEISRSLSATGWIRSLQNAFPPATLFCTLGENLSEILKGCRSPLPILFPDEITSKHEGQFQSPLRMFYERFPQLFNFPEMISEVLSKWLEQSSSTNSVMRILEIGAGTGHYTALLLEVLSKFEIQFEYIFTDISSSFFAAARKRFQRWEESMSFMKLNVEEDPLEQGFVPEYFDYVCADNVLHATKNIRETIGNVKMLMKINGRLDMIEMPSKSRICTYLFGVLDGFWRFQDKELRPDHCTLPIHKWKWALQQEGLEMIAEFPAAEISHHSLISCRRPEVKPLTIEGISGRNNGASKVWIHFHQGNSPASEFLQKKILELQNRQILEVTPGNEFSFSGSRCEVRKNTEKDFSSLLKVALEIGSSLEGVLYCWTLDKKVSSQEDTLQPFFYLAKSLINFKEGDNIRLVSLFQGLASVDGSVYGNPHHSTVWQFTRCLQAEHPDIKCRCIDIGNFQENSDDEMFHLFSKLWKSNQISEPSHVAIVTGSDFIPKLETHLPQTKKLKLPLGANRFQLALPETKLIGDLEFAKLEECVMGDLEVEVEVKASALNFADVMSVLKPSTVFSNINGIGNDIAGIVRKIGKGVRKWKVGDFVFTWNPKLTPFHSHVVIDQDDVYPLSREMSWNEAATLPAAFITAYLALVETAKVRKGEIVLLHAASGGVGLCAIQLCKLIGATVICTAGNKRKRSYLRSIGIQNVFNSRTTDFGPLILQVTEGRGVDVVLNSLTGEGFTEATLSCCATGARFVEMSKYNILTNDECNKLRRDVDYTVINVQSLERKNLQSIMEILTEFIAEGKICALPYLRFDGEHIIDALQYMQKAKHIGKIVCAMPELKQVEGRTEVDTPIFHSKGTYLITGGRVGGIGFSVCQWMVEKGAKYVLLATRSTANKKDLKEIERLNVKYGGSVTHIKLDVGDFSQCEDLVDSKIPEMAFPPIKGIMHCAGALSDGLLQNQSWEELAIPLKAKVTGTVNLHRMTSNTNLEHFVLFSSVASLFGLTGQANHGAANRFEEQYTHYRHSLGLPATVITIGHWVDVGIANEIDVVGIKPFSNEQGIAGLEYALKSHRTHTVLANFEPFHVLERRAPQLQQYLGEGLWKSNELAGCGSSDSCSITNSVNFWKEVDSSENEPSKLSVIKSYITSILKGVLNLKPSDVIKCGQLFQEIGLDSLMSIELRNAVRAIVNSRLSITSSQLSNLNSIDELSSTVLGLISQN